MTRSGDGERPVLAAGNSLGGGAERAHGDGFRSTMAAAVNSSPSPRTRALLMLVLATACWGLSFPLIKAILAVHGGFAPADGAGWMTVMVVAPRFALATLAVAAWLGRGFWRVTRGEWVQGVMIGSFAGVGTLLQSDGLQYTAASTSAFLTQLYAILIPAYVAWRARRWPGAAVWVSAALVLAGVAILGNFDGRALRFGRGEAETLLASAFFMGQILWLDRPEFAGNRPLRLTLVMFATQAAIYGVLAAVAAPDLAAALAPWRSPAWVALTLGLTGICTVGAFLLMNTWQPKITATEAGLIYCVEPIFGSLMALFLPAWFSAWAGIGYANETATFNLLLGGGLITAANILIQLKPPAKG